MPDHFECDYCKRYFIRKYNLQRHIEKCHLRSVLTCEICDHKFTSFAGLQVHFSRGHNNSGQPFPECDLCGRVFTRKQNIVSHMKTIHENAAIIRCNLCDRSFLRQINYRQHMNTLHKPDELTCNGCQNVFYDKHSLVVHMQASGCQRPSIECPLCDRVYCDKRSLRRHLRFHDGQGEFKCTYCPKVYMLNQSLSRHIKARHRAATYDTMPQDVETISQGCCEECGKLFDLEYELRQHIKNEHSFNAFYKYCKLSLMARQTRMFIHTSSNNTQRVVEEQPDFDGDKLSSDDLETTEQSEHYPCDYCDNIFTNIFELKHHIKTFHRKEYGFSTCNVCFLKFFSKESRKEHSKTCRPPENANTCCYCDKLFTDISSLEFHTRIFHPQAQTADSNITSTNNEDERSLTSCSQNASVRDTFKCKYCDRVYSTERSLKHHLKLRHTTDEEVHCELCGKTYSNRFYLIAHVKGVHNEEDVAKCDYCDKFFRGKRNIKRHIEYTHLGRKRYKCVECETLFKEKRSLRKHVRRKHPNSTVFPECHFCNKRFESAKSRKIHLKLLHSYNMDTYPCHLCSVSLSSKTLLELHLRSKHLAEDEIYKCDACSLVFQGLEKFEEHNDSYHVNLVQTTKVKVFPRCILCMKDFSTRKTLKRHINKFHDEFNVDDLADFGTRRRVFTVECEECIRNFNDDLIYEQYQKQKHFPEAIIFKCEHCSYAYSAFEYSIQRYKAKNCSAGSSKMILSELCTTEMSDDDIPDPDTNGIVQEYLEPESTTDFQSELLIRKLEPMDEEELHYKVENSGIKIKVEPIERTEALRTEEYENVSPVKMEFKEEPYF